MNITFQVNGANYSSSKVALLDLASSFVGGIFATAGVFFLIMSLTGHIHMAH
jgi:hypothetical protein